MQRRSSARNRNQAVPKEEPAENTCRCWACEPTDCGECYICENREKSGNRLCDRIRRHELNPEPCARAAATDEISSRANDSPVTDKQNSLKVIADRIMKGLPAGGENVREKILHTTALLKLAFASGISSCSGLGYRFGLDMSNPAVASYYVSLLEDDDSLTESDLKTVATIIQEAAVAPDLQAGLVRCNNEETWDCSACEKIATLKAITCKTTRRKSLNKYLRSPESRCARKVPEIPTNAVRVQRCLDRIAGNPDVNTGLYAWYRTKMNSLDQKALDGFLYVRAFAYVAYKQEVGRSTGGLSDGGPGLEAALKALRGNGWSRQTKGVRYNNDGDHIKMRVEEEVVMEVTGKRICET